MLLMPHVAHALLPHSEQVGLFLGLAVHDTAQVVGSALTYKTMFGDELALQVAIVTKLTRNLFLAAAIPGLIAMNARAEARLAAAPSTAANGAGGNSSVGPPSALTLAKLKTYVPPFVLGFLAMAAVRSTGDAMVAAGHPALGVLGPSEWKDITSFVGGTLGSHYLLGTAMAAVGLSTSLSSLRDVGPRPFIVGLVGAAAVSSAGMACALALPHLTTLAAS
jgi:uncharacterized membrane protein YadS